VLALCMVFSLCASAMALEVSMVADKSVVRPNETVTVSISISETVTGILGGCGLHYNPELFELEESNLTEPFGLGDVQDSQNGDGSKYYTISFMNVSNATVQQGQIASLTFTAIKEVTAAELGSFYITEDGWGDADVDFSVTITAGGMESPVEVSVAPQPVTAEVTYSAQGYGAYMLPVTTAEVSSDLAENYGYTDSVRAGIAVSALDAMVKAHVDMFGEAFTAETAADYLALSSSGYVSKLFGVATYASGFMVNGGYPNDGTESAYGGYNGTTVNQTALDANDVVDFYIYQDGSYYTDYYTYVTAPESIMAGEPAEFTVTGIMAMMGYMYENPEAAKAAATVLGDVQLAVVDEDGIVTLLNDDYTDNKGKITVTFAEAGTYNVVAYVSAEDVEDGVTPVIMNPITVTVVSPVTAEVSYSAQGYGAYMLPVTTAEVSSDLAENYGYTDSVPVGTAVSALDVLVKAHEDMLGDVFTAETAAEYLVVSEYGFVNKLFGEETSANGFIVNDGYPNDGTLSSWGYNGTTVTTTAVGNDDVVDFFLYQDRAYWSDTFTYVTAPESVAAGKPAEFTVSGVMYISASMYQNPEELKEAAEAMEDVQLAVVDESGAVTLLNDNYSDENGKITVTFAEAGTYTVVAYVTAEDVEEGTAPVIMNPVSVTVLPYGRAENKVHVMKSDNSGEFAMFKASSSSAVLNGDKIDIVLTTTNVSFDAIYFGSPDDANKTGIIEGVQNESGAWVFTFSVDKSLVGARPEVTLRKVSDGSWYKNTKNAYTLYLDIPELASVTLGDVNVDGAMDLKDISLLYRYYCGQAEISACGMTVADFTADAIVNLRDVAAMFRAYSQK